MECIAQWSRWLQRLVRLRPNPLFTLRENGRFCRKLAAISALTAFAQNEHIADSRGITQFEFPNFSETLACARSAP